MIVGAFETSFPFGMVTSARPARSATTPSTAAARNLKCGYPSKICTNERAWKRDGSLHRFCEQHRARANTNQKRWAQRKARSNKGEKTTENSDIAKGSPSVDEYAVDESLLQAEAPMDFSDFDMTLDLLLKDASFWSPTAAAATSNGHHQAQWECEELTTQSIKEEDAMEAELWALLGLGNLNMS